MMKRTSFFFFFFLVLVLEGLVDLHAATAAKLLRSCLTLCDPIDGSPPGSAVPGIFQTRVLEGVAIAFSILCLLEEDKSSYKSFGNYILWRMIERIEDVWWLRW